MNKAAPESGLVRLRSRAIIYTTMKFVSLDATEVGVSAAPYAY